MQVPKLTWSHVGSKNKYQKDMSSKEIGLLSRNMILIILGSIVNIILCGRRGYTWPLSEHGIFTSIMNQIFILVPTTLRKVCAGSI